MSSKENRRWVEEAAANRLNFEPALVSTSHGDFASHYMAAATMAAEERKPQMEAYLQEFAQAYGNESMRDKPFVFYNGLAVIPVHGALLNRFPYAFSFATGYNFIRSQLNAALQDDEVKGIVFDIDSGGGEAAGCMELSDEIREAREIKPSLAIVDSFCASAAYAIGSAATTLVSIPSGVSGSVGVVAMHVNLSKMLENFGVEVTFIWAGEDKIEGNPYEKLSDKARAQIKQRIDLRYGEFVTLVANNRSLSEDAVRETKARTFTAGEAVELGLIDAVAAPSAAIAQFHDSLSGPPSTESDEMTTQATQNHATKAGNTDDKAGSAASEIVDTASVQQAERQRMSAIVNCEEAKTNPGLANHFAFDTSMSAEDAQAALKASSPVQPEKEEPKKEEASAVNPLDSAMAASGGGAGVPAESGEDAGDDKAKGQSNAGFDAMLAVRGESAKPKTH